MPHLGSRAFLESFVRLLLQNALENASITPSSTEGYTPKEVADAIQQSLGVLPLLHCTDGEIEEVR